MVNGAVENDILRWIPLLPLLAAAYHGLMLGLVRRATPRWFTIALSCGVVMLSFVLACSAFWELIQLPEGSRALIHKGKELSMDDDKFRMYAQKGYDYEDKKNLAKYLSGINPDLDDSKLLALEPAFIEGD